MRREQERRNSDMYSARVHGPPRHGGRQDARACRVGGGQGDGGGYRAPAGGRFAGRAPVRFQYGYGPRDGGYTLSGFANPSVEQMARHCFASHFANISVETFAHHLSRY